MKITKQKLKLLVESMILNEGQVEDLLAANPQLKPAVDAGIRNLNHLKWLLRMEKFEPIVDMVGLIPAFEQNKQRLAIKDLDSYKSPNVLRAALEALGESKGEQRRQLKESETDTVYNSETWLVVMPHTMESSIQWGKGTTWCTAATKSANLFYSYAGRKDEDIILFYIIRKGADSELDPSAKLSVGFVNGKPVLDGKSGGVSVDAANIGLDEQKLKTVLADRYDAFMSAMKKHATSIGDKHPAKKAMQKIAQAKNPSVLEKYTIGMNLKERNDFVNVLLEYDLSAEMLSYLASDESVNIRQSIAVKPSTPPELVSRLARDENNMVRVAVTYNPEVSLEVLTQLASDVSANVRQGVAMSERASPELLAQFVNDKSEHVRWVLAKNPNTSVEVLAQLANDKSQNVRSTLAQNSNTTAEVLAKLVSDKDDWVNTNIAKNPKTPLEALSRLAKNKSWEVRSIIAQNPNTPPEILSMLADDENSDVKSEVAKNPNTPLDVLIDLERDDFMFLAVEQNPTYQKYLESQKQLNERWIRLAGLTKRKLA